MSKLNASLVCPRCKEPVVRKDDGASCTGCGASYGLSEEILDMYRREPDGVERRTSYLWSDVDHFRRILEDLVRPESFVVEVCAGPNVIVPYLLQELQPRCEYLSIGNSTFHLTLQAGGVPAFHFERIRGDSISLMLADGCVDVLVSHHAINDIWLSRGTEGVMASLDEALRVVRPEGAMVFSHCLMDWDPSTREVSLEQVAEHLGRKRGDLRMNFSRGEQQDWLVVRV